MALISRIKPVGAALLALAGGSVLVGVLAVGMSTAAYAQEAMWRVENTEPAQVAPPYQGEATPFPVQVRPKIEEKKAQKEANKEVANEAEVRAQQQAYMAAGLLAEIRDILQKNDAFSVDTSGIQVRAVTTGPGGDMALIKGNWLSVGDAVEAPVVTAQRVLSKLEKLEKIDVNLADIVRSEVKAKVAGASKVKIKISAISEKGVSFKLPKGGKTVISFQHSDW